MLPLKAGDRVAVYTGPESHGNWRELGIVMSVTGFRVMVRPDAYPLAPRTYHRKQIRKLLKPGESAMRRRVWVDLENRTWAGHYAFYAYDEPYLPRLVEFVERVKA